MSVDNMTDPTAAAAAPIVDPQGVVKIMTEAAEAARGVVADMIGTYAHQGNDRWLSEVKGTDLACWHDTARLTDTDFGRPIVPADDRPVAQDLAEAIAGRLAAGLLQMPPDLRAALAAAIPGAAGHFSMPGSLWSGPDAYWLQAIARQNGIQLSIKRPDGSLCWEMVLL